MTAAARVYYADVRTKGGYEAVYLAADYDALSKERDALAERVRELEAVLSRVKDLPFELNVSNYTHDDVCELNERVVEVIILVRTALRSLPTTPPALPDHFPGTEADDLLCEHDRNADTCGECHGQFGVGA